LSWNASEQELSLSVALVLQRSSDRSLFIQRDDLFESALSWVEWSLRSSLWIIDRNCRSQWRSAHESMIATLFSFESHLLFKNSFVNHWWTSVVQETRFSESWIHTCQCLSADRLHEACLALLSHEFYVLSRSCCRWEYHSDMSDRIYVNSWTTHRWYSAERTQVHWLIWRALFYTCRHRRK